MDNLKVLQIFDMFFNNSFDMNEIYKCPNIEFLYYNCKFGFVKELNVDNLIHLKKIKSNINSIIGNSSKINICYL